MEKTKLIGYENWLSSFLKKMVACSVCDFSISSVHYREQLEAKKSYHNSPFCQVETFFLCSVFEKILYQFWHKVLFVIPAGKDWDIFSVQHDEHTESGLSPYFYQPSWMQLTCFPELFHLFSEGFCARVTIDAKGLRHWPSCIGGRIVDSRG